MRTGFNRRSRGHIADMPASYPFIYTTRYSRDAALVIGDRAPAWMWNLLDLNPDYTSWGPTYGGQHLPKNTDSSVFDNWGEFVADNGGINFEPDESNEIAHFYFGLEQTTESSPLRCFLVLWVLHPRTSASIQVKIEQVDQRDLDAILSCLGAAAVRNIARFGPLMRLVAIPVSSGSRVTRPNLLAVPKHRG